ncbi:hypothetical protein NDU88_004809 [Pleurodeles waltl]|uniref:Uncharacterized protein n=1 Tax=Pleurodeles waltl TaxID=8319 RepID=A0AAV7QIX5_PLEWA|nr:hypothetical protein NDU88_004809 [Pleurodeles waltl]
MKYRNSARAAEPQCMRRVQMVQMGRRGVNNQTRNPLQELEDESYARSEVNKEYLLPLPCVMALRTKSDELKGQKMDSYCMAL